ncbi:hypothetical protein IEU95_03685 [Hoyosella rhizosphaerae]|uniref:Uncharacterized protein n=1 Tax=Hoyosella rhizosphaerae TaxID=1755582 RepID=A0A916UB35_9ACTN|nr:hypothetical protein [Hoyosella rhizosphaerae]MBN4925917.1 hypothetical protein [Hoyosella rhizosphaerae]GGC66947.1 hypothetical protein GCM10011410_19490 [Hoyosella rhizosphaerae]
MSSNNNQTAPEKAIDDAIVALETESREKSGLPKKVRQAGVVGLAATRGPVGLGVLAAQKARKVRKAKKNDKIDAAANGTPKRRRSRKVRAAQVLIGITGAIGLAGIATYMAKHWEELSEDGVEMPNINLGYDSQT